MTMDDDNIVSRLSEIGSAVLKALLELGVGTQRATDAQTRYVKVVSGMVNEARNFKTFGGSGAVTIKDLDPKRLLTAVFLQKSEWGRIWIDEKDGLQFLYQSERGQGDRHLEESSFRV